VAAGSAATRPAPLRPAAGALAAGHRGVDLAGQPGIAVLAAGDGVVAFAGSVAGRGVVSVDHPDGLRTTYEPVVPVASVGRRVVAGETVGPSRPGHPGCPAAACLHWGARSAGGYVDPLAALGRGRLRLLPLAEQSG
jgi:murein DD-endopeptidase MepM/ murein hydrolase activator NlpD